MDPKPSSRRRRLFWWIGIPAVPVLLTLALGLFADPNGSALLVPLAGPWAGLVYGHFDCTMAVQAPLWTAGSIGVGLLTVVAIWPRRRRRPWLACLLASSWSLSWCGLAILSVLNTLT